MNSDALLKLLKRVSDHSCTVNDALEKMRDLPFTEAAQTLADTHREIRTGLPEVVFARHKTADQIAEALNALHSAHGYALATHVPQEMTASLSAQFPGAAYDAVSKLFALGRMEPKKNTGTVAVICAGTSDLPVAEEAAQTLEFAGIPVSRVRDAGVAGLHRLLDKLPVLRGSSVIIAIAGMEGALPGVVAALVSQPVIAVPTSIGYGASFAGVSALLTMLNSCSGGLGVVNIDNGFGAALLAIRILRQD
jgi:pyridinium-3,5-biscarboxylic acid mononucleotide synthase